MFARRNEKKKGMRTIDFYVCLVRVLGCRINDKFAEITTNNAVHQGNKYVK